MIQLDRKLNQKVQSMKFGSHHGVATLLAIAFITLLAGFFYTPVKAQDMGALVTVTTTGSGIVESGVGWANPISCPGDCTGNTTGGGFAQLFARPADGWSAQGWGGLCAGQARRDLCVVNFFAGGSVSMTFERPTPDIDLHGGPFIWGIINGSTTTDPYNGTDFGVTNLSGGAIDQTFSLSNRGTGALTLTGTPLVSLTGPNAADFTLLTPPASSVAPDSSTTFVLRFDPSAVGMRTATVNIASNDGDEPLYTFAIQGKGHDSAGGGPTPVNYSESLDGDMKNDTVYVPCSVSGFADEFILGIGVNRWTGTFGVTGNGVNQNDMFRALLPAGALIDRITFQREAGSGTIFIDVTDAASKTILHSGGTGGLFAYNPPSQNSVLNFMLAADFNPTPKAWTVTVNVIGSVPGGSGPLLTFESKTPAQVVVDEGKTGTACGRFSDRERDAVTLLAPLTASPVLTETGPIQTFADAPANSSGRWEWAVSAIDGPGNSQQVRLHATDNNPSGSSSSYLEFPLTVVNVAPSVQKPTVSPVPSNEIATVTAQATWSDPGVLDIATCTVNYGDGSPVVAGTATFNRGSGLCVGPSHTYADSGTYVISFVVTDKDGGVGSSSLSHVVNNLPPVISAVTNNGPVKAKKALLITANAADPAGNVDPLTYAFDCDNDSLYEIGPISQNSASCTFNVAGQYSVNVQVRDDDGGVASASTLVTIVANSAPVANNQSVTLNEDTSIATTLTASDANGDSLTYTVVKGPDHGSLSGTPPALTYKPAANYRGTDSFTFKANDGEADSQVATISITINGVNDAPVANDDSFTTNEDTPLSASVAGNDSDVDGHTITYFLQGNVAHGTLTLKSDGSFTYTPAVNYRGTDSFTYQANDGLGGMDTATVNITINGVNDAPVAVDDSFTTDEDTPLSATVAGNDSDADGHTISYFLQNNVAHGTLTLKSDGSFTYTPAANFNGADSFTYQANDGLNGIDTATVNLTISAVNDAPVANNDSFSTNEGTLLSASVAGNDSDIDGDMLVYSLIGDVSHGALVLNPDGSFTYTPTAAFNGADSFTYQAADGNDNTATATVTFTVGATDEPVEQPTETPTPLPTEVPAAVPTVVPTTVPTEVPTAVPTEEPVDQPVNNPTNNLLPLARNDAAATIPQSAVTINVLANDSDPRQGGLTLNMLGTAAHGTVIAEGNRAIYTPAADFVGMDSFEYSLRDSSGNTDSAHVYVVVSAAGASGFAPQVAPVQAGQAGVAHFSVDGATIEIVWPSVLYSGTADAKEIIYLLFTPLTMSDDAGQDAPGFVFGGIIFDLSIYRNDTKLENYTFTPPLQMTIRYDLAASNLASPAELAQESLTLRFWNGMNWESSGITLVSHDLQTHELIFSIEHLSEFALFGISPTTLEPADPPTPANRILLPLVSR